MSRSHSTTVPPSPPFPPFTTPSPVARSLSIVFNVVFTFLILGKSTSLMTCSTLLVVMFGFYLGIEGEINFSLFGTLAGVVSSVFVSLNSIFTAKVLPLVNEDKSLLLYYNNVNAMILFIPLIIIFEKEVCSPSSPSTVSSLFSSHPPPPPPLLPCGHAAMQTILENSEKLTSGFFWFVMTITGAMGFAIGLVTVMQVKATSPLTHNISGTAKAAAQVLHPSPLHSSHAFSFLHRVSWHSICGATPSRCMVFSVSFSSSLVLDCILSCR
jgi:solute carrier family 35 (GDP-fucose transporter), member C1